MKKCFVVTIFLAMGLVGVSAGDGDSIGVKIEFVGDDGQTPIFRSEKCKNVSKCLQLSRNAKCKDMNVYTCFPDSVVYKYAGNRLMKTNVVAPSGFVLRLVKNGVYVFREEIDSLTYKYLLKANGKETIARFISPSSYWNVVMNDRYLFIAGEYKKQGRTIYKVDYRNQAKIDTFQITEQYGPELMGADSNYLYYVAQIDDDRDPCIGELFRMDIKTGVSDVVLYATTLVTEGMLLVVPLKLFYSHGGISDYGKNVAVMTPDAAWLQYQYDVFYSYEDKAFIIYMRTMDINEWYILRLDDISEWVPSRWWNTDKYTGPRAVPFIKRCEKDRCAIGVARDYREKTGCTDLSNLSGNQMYDYLVKMSNGPQSKFKEVEIEETYTLADKGLIVIAAHKDSKEHGHITLIVSGRSVYNDLWPRNDDPYNTTYIPFVKDTGSKKPVEKQPLTESYEPYKRKDVRFFVYMGVTCKKQ